MTPEQLARDAIDVKLEHAGWKVQSKNSIDFNAGAGIAVREYQTDVGPADYVLFIEREPVGVIEAKPEAWGQKITTVEEQSAGYAEANLKWLRSAEPRPLVYESTGALTRFTEQAVADGGNVGHEVYVIETERTQRGGRIEAGRQVERREVLTRRRRWETQDAPYVYVYGAKSWTAPS